MENQETPRKLEPVGDLEMMCPQCGQDWIFTESERRRIVRENLPKPKRCPECRQENRKESKGDAVMPDRNITCPDCRKEFVFSEGEQNFFRSKGLSEPKRCKPCRQARKEQREGPKEQRDPE